MNEMLINGCPSHLVSAQDRGFQYGDGLFETIRCVQGKLQFWQQHFERLQQGGAKLNITIPSQETVLQDIRTLYRQDLADCVFKITVTRGETERGYLYPERIKSNRVVQMSAASCYPEEYYSTGIALTCCAHPISVNPALAGIKHLNRLDNVMARHELDKRFQEGLMLDHEGKVIEGTMSNLFAVKQGVLFTPELSGCGVDGIIRRRILALCEQLKLRVNITCLDKQALLQADELFVCNSLIGIWPVISLDEKHYDSKQTADMLAAELDKVSQQHAVAVNA